MVYKQEGVVGHDFLLTVKRNCCLVVDAAETQLAGEKKVNWQFNQTSVYGIFFGLLYTEKKLFYDLKACDVKRKESVLIRKIISKLRLKAYQDRDNLWLF